MEIECDVLVVGAGPAGAVTSLYCSKNGLDTVLIEKNDKIGTKYTKIDSSPDFGLTRIIKELGLKTENHVYKSKWHSSSGRSFTLHSKIGEYYFKRGPEPDSFECSTVDKAVKHGCKLFLGATLKKIDRKGEGFGRAIVVQEGAEIMISPRIIIMADGGDSFFHEYIDKRIVKEKIFGYGMTGTDFVSSDTSEIYFDAELCPGGYFYILTSLNGVSSAAIGLDPSKIKDTVEKYFDEFLDKNPTIADKIKSFDSKFAGYGYLFRLERHFYDNLILIGEAGGLIDPLLGYGMMPAIVSAYYGGKYSVEALNKNDYSKLEGYEEEIKKRFDRKFDYFYRKVFSSLDNEDFDLIIKMADELESRMDVDTFIHKYTIGGMRHAFMIFFNNLPRSALLLFKIMFQAIKG